MLRKLRDAIAQYWQGLVSLQSRGNQIYACAHRQSARVPPPQQAPHEPKGGGAGQTMAAAVLLPFIRQ